VSLLGWVLLERFVHTDVAIRTTVSAGAHLLADVGTQSNLMKALTDPPWNSSVWV
jgi:hypothetical protein